MCTRVCVSTRGGISGGNKKKKQHKMCTKCFQMMDFLFFLLNEKKFSKGDRLVSQDSETHRHGPFQAALSPALCGQAGISMCPLPLT